MNKLVSLPVAAIPLASPSTAADGDSGLQAQIARLEQAIEVLRTRYVCAGWKLDEEGAERALRYWRRGCPDDEDQTEWGATLRFIGSHGLSFDWIMTGDVSSMICAGASQSRAALRAAAIADPTFAAIEAHRKAYDALSVEIVKTDDLEAAIPKDQRKSSINCGEIEIVETDDPRWIEFKQLLTACNNTEDEALSELADVVPTSTAGMLALLEYTAEHEKKGDAWPNLCEDENDRWGHSFYYFIHRNLAESLRPMAA